MQHNVTQWWVPSAEKVHEFHWFGGVWVGNVHLALGILSLETDSFSPFQEVTVTKGFAFKAMTPYKDILLGSYLFPKDMVETACLV